MTDLSPPNSPEGRDAATMRRAGLVTTCREDVGDSRCGMTAEFILWGKLIPPEGLGPRCYNHAAKHVGHRALGDPQWAIADLRPLLDSLGVNRVGD